MTSNINTDIDQDSVSVVKGSDSSQHNVQDVHLDLTKWTKDHPIHQVIGDPNLPVQTSATTANECSFSIFLNKTEPTRVSDALEDPD